MVSLVGRWTLMAGAVASVSTLVPVAAPVHAQGWGTPSCRGLDGRERTRCERAREREQSRWERDRNQNQRDRERERRKDARVDGIVAGVVGTVLIGGIIAAATSGGDKKKKEARDRRSYCMDRYGNYDERTDSYRASNGRWYRCE